MYIICCTIFFYILKVVVDQELQRNLESMHPTQIIILEEPHVPATQQNGTTNIEDLRGVTDEQNARLTEAVPMELLEGEVLYFHMQ